MKLPLIPHTKNKLKSDEASGILQSLQRKLARNALSEFKIGYDANEFRSKRDVQNLIHVIQNQYLHRVAIDKISFLERISIGWKLPPFTLRLVLEQVIPMLLQKPAKVRHLQLMLNAWVPLSMIEKILSSSSTLETLDLRAVKIRTQILSESRSGHRGCRHSESHTLSLSNTISLTTRSEPSRGDDYIIVDNSVLAVLPYLPPTIKALKLVDCNLQPRHMPELMQILRNKRNIELLSLRLNRDLCMTGWENVIFEKLFFLTALDLSICDLDSIDGMYLATALKESTTSNIKSLSVAGNYRLHESLPKLVEACALAGVIEFDCSFCDVQNNHQQTIFDVLATVQPCSIRSFRMHSTGIKNITPLVNCIENNTSIERLILNHPREPFSLSMESLDRLLVAIKKNYYLKVFKVDRTWDQDPKVIEEMEYWMKLNQCGRSILLYDETKYLPRVLANIASLHDIDTFYCFLRNGAEQFDYIGKMMKEECSVH